LKEAPARVVAYFQTVRCVFALFCSFYSRKLEQWLQMLLPVICSAFRPSSSNKHRVLFDRMFSTFIRRSPRFSGAGSGSVGHK